MGNSCLVMFRCESLLPPLPSRCTLFGFCRVASCCCLPTFRVFGPASSSILALLRPCLFLCNSRFSDRVQSRSTFFLTHEAPFMNEPLQNDRNLALDKYSIFPENPHLTIFLITVNLYDFHQNKLRACRSSEHYPTAKTRPND